MTAKPNVKSVFKYALNNIEFYKSGSYEHLRNLNSKNLEDVIKDIPIISGEVFMNNFYKFIPDIRTRVSLFQTSGSTGKPKVIPVTYDE